jgi:chemotaxis protein CheD
MAKKIQVSMAQFHVAKRPEVLEALALGSCVAVILYDKRSGVAGMMHAMLPASCHAREKIRKEKGRFVDTSLQVLYEAVLKNGAKKEFLKAKMAGGANMFPDVPRETAHIGKQNADAAIQKLKEMNIELVAHDVGGSQGRTVRYDTEKNSLEIRTIADGIKEI